MKKNKIIIFFKTPPFAKGGVFCKRIRWLLPGIFVKINSMDLYIDTSKNNIICLSLKSKNKIIDKIEIEARYSQAELLLPAIEQMLVKTKIKLSEIKKIIVADKGKGFTALRIGIVTSNALGFALGVPVNKELGKNNKYCIVKPIYNREPNIT